MYNINIYLFYIIIYLFTFPYLYDYVYISTLYCPNNLIICNMCLLFALLFLCLHVDRHVTNAS